MHNWAQSAAMAALRERCALVESECSESVRVFPIYFYLKLAREGTYFAATVLQSRFRRSTASLQQSRLV